MDQCTHKVRDEYWKGIIQACSQRPAGQSAKNWMDENGICEQSYYHWQRKFRQQAYGLIQERAAVPAVSEETDVAFVEVPYIQQAPKGTESAAPSVAVYFAWVKKQLEDTVVPPKSKTADGLRYSVNQEKYLRVFLTDGSVPIDNSASERAIRTFCIGKKNWMFHDSIMGAQASAVIYSLSETAKINNLRPYYYFKHLLTELPNLCDEEGDIEPTKLDHLLPWSKELPEECRKPRR